LELIIEYYIQLHTTSSSIEAYSFVRISLVLFAFTHLSQKMADSSALHVPAEPNVKFSVPYGEECPGYLSSISAGGLRNTEEGIV
jgi:hypothetical protein